MSHYENVPFDVPDGWCWSSIENVCSKFTTGPFGSMVHKSDYVTDGGVPMVNPANMIGGNISYNKLMFVSELRAKDLQRYRLEPSDILLARRGDLTKCVVIKDEQKEWLCGTGSFVLHTILLLPAYFELLYSSTYIQSILTSESVGATMDNLNQGLLGSIIIPIPPIEEQQRIVTSVGLWFSLINNLEFGYSELNQSIIKTKSKILDLAIHGKLVPQDPTDEPASELLKRINPKAVISCDNPHYEQVPTGWTKTRLGNLINIVSGVSYNKSDITSNSHGIRILRGGNVQNGKIILEENDVYVLSAYHDDDKIVKKGDIVIVASTGSQLLIGKTGYAKHDFSMTQIGAFLRIIRTKASHLSPYINLVLCSDSFKEHIQSLAKGTNINNLKANHVTDFEILMPPYKEQQRIVVKVEELHRTLDKIAECLS